MQLGLIAGLIAFSLLSTPVLAVQESGTTTTTTTNPTESILISPASKKYQLKAGESQSDKLRVVNDGQTAFDFTVYARPYSVTNEGYTPDFMATTQNADVYRWVSFDKTSFRLEPGAFVEVGYVIRVPSDATPGGHYGVIFAETQPVGDGSAVVRKKRVGSILYATVDGEITTSGKLLSTSVPFFQFRAPLQASERVRNAGNTDFTVDSTIEVTDVFGNVKHRAVRQSAVLPDTTRRIVSDWSDPSWIGLYRVTMTTKFLDTNASSTHYVLFVPIWVYAALVLLIGGRVIYGLARRRKTKRKK